MHCKFFIERIHKKELQQSYFFLMPSIHLRGFDFIKQLFRIQIQKGEKALHLVPAQRAFLEFRNPGYAKIALLGL